MEKKSSLVTCSMIAGALLSVSAVKANSLLEYNALGTAGEVRTSLVKTIVANCGEKKTETDHTKTKDANAERKKRKTQNAERKKQKTENVEKVNVERKKERRRKKKRPIQNKETVSLPFLKRRAGFLLVIT